MRTISTLDTRRDRGVHQILIRCGGEILSLVQFRLFWRLCRLLAPLTPGDDRRILELNSDTRLQIHLRDPYWSRLVCRRYSYEPEIEKVISLIDDIPFVLIDCGANIGYWSAFVTQRSQAHSAIAVEADPRMFQELCVNARLNHDRFSCLHRAVAHDSGSILWLQEPPEFWESGLHADIRVVERNEKMSQPGEVSVESISLDGIAEMLPHLRSAPFVVKLDVEGMEIAALEGGSKVLTALPLVIYEDHGRDRENTVSRYVLNALGYHVFGWDNDCKRMLQLLTVDSIGQRKTRQSVGYNFFACGQDSIFYPRLLGAT